jgi:hypothetical protein
MVLFVSPLLLVGFKIHKIGKIGAYIFHRRLFSATNKTATLSAETAHHNKKTNPALTHRIDPGTFVVF